MTTGGTSPEGTHAPAGTDELCATADTDLDAEDRSVVASHDVYDLAVHEQFGTVSRGEGHQVVHEGLPTRRVAPGGVVVGEHGLDGPAGVGSQSSASRSK